jgi:hypothetical protein
MSISPWVYQLSPRAGEEWVPRVEKSRFISSVEKTPLEAELEEKIKEMEDEVLEHVKPLIADGYFDEREKESIKRYEEKMGEDYVAIVDPLAIYLPYHKWGWRWGIYFRIIRMISDFKDLVAKFKAAWLGAGGGKLEVEDLWGIWRIYVEAIFWHELAHHVVEDIASALEGYNTSRYQVGKYPLLRREVEEGFCEYTAFTTAERGFPIPLPLSGRMPIPERRERWSEWEAPLAESLRRSGTSLREAVLSSLYYHWGRDDPQSAYHPVVDPEVPRKVDGLWEAFWGAHLRLYEFMWDLERRIFCVTF